LLNVERNCWHAKLIKSLSNDLKSIRNFINFIIQ
jgi:hypothetical protein